MVGEGIEKNLGIVSECQVADCTYNEEQQCKAGAIYINIEDGRAICADYTTETLKQIHQELEEVGDVSQCTVIDCAYNEGQSCVAKFVIVASSNDNAICATYIKK